MRPVCGWDPAVVLRMRCRMEDEPIAGELNELPPVSVRPVSHRDLEPLWNKLLRQHHYLGFGKLLGHQLKYLAFMDQRPVAALSWSAGALKLRGRDRFIGWSDAQRKDHLKRIANQSRFLILPHVQVPNLASHELALNIRRLNEDWKKCFGYELWLLETCGSGPLRRHYLQGSQLALPGAHPRLR